MTLAQATARHAQLADEIRRHDHAYYVVGRQEISDREYELLMSELKCARSWPQNLVSHA